MSEALRLATAPGAVIPVDIETTSMLAAELRRLHIENEALSKWEASYNAVCDERDAIASDADKAYELLRWAETEMRYAGWGTRVNDQHGRTDVYEAIKEFLK